MSFLMLCVFLIFGKQLYIKITLISIFKVISFSSSLKSPILHPESKLLVLFHNINNMLKMNSLGLWSFKDSHKY